MEKWNNEREREKKILNEKIFRLNFVQINLNPKEVFIKIFSIKQKKNKKKRAKRYSKLKFY